MYSTWTGWVLTQGPNRGQCWRGKRLRCAGWSIRAEFWIIGKLHTVDKAVSSGFRRDWSPITVETQVSNRNLTIALAHFAAESEVDCDLFIVLQAENTCRHVISLLWKNSGSYSSMPFPSPAETFVEPCHRVVCGSPADVNKFSWWTFSLVLCIHFRTALPQTCRRRPSAPLFFLISSNHVWQRVATGRRGQRSLWEFMGLVSHAFGCDRLFRSWTVLCLCLHCHHYHYDVH